MTCVRIYHHATANSSNDTKPDRGRKSGTMLRQTLVNSSHLANMGTTTDNHSSGVVSVTHSRYTVSKGKKHKYEQSVAHAILIVAAKTEGQSSIEQSQEGFVQPAPLFSRHVRARDMRTNNIASNSRRLHTSMRSVMFHQRA